MSKKIKEKIKEEDEKEKKEENEDNEENNENNNNDITENYDDDDEDEIERSKKEEIKLDKMYKKKLEAQKKECCKELKILNEKLNKIQKYKKGYYELFLIENDINIQLQLIEKNLKNDGEKKLYKDMKKDFKNLRKELAEIRGEE